MESPVHVRQLTISEFLIAIPFSHCQYAKEKVGYKQKPEGCAYAWMDGWMDTLMGQQIDR